MSNEKCIIDPQRDCLGLQKADMLEKQMEKLQEQARDTHGKLFDRIRELEKAEAARNEQYDNIMEKLDKLTGDDSVVTFTVSADVSELPASVTKFVD